MKFVFSLHIGIKQDLLNFFSRSCTREAEIETHLRTDISMGFKAFTGDVGDRFKTFCLSLIWSRNLNLGPPGEWPNHQATGYARMSLNFHYIFICWCKTFFWDQTAFFNGKKRSLFPACSNYNTSYMHMYYSVEY